MSVFDKRDFRTLYTSRNSGTATLRRNWPGQPGVRWDNRVAGQGNLRRSGGGNMADDEIFRAAPGQGLVVSTGILGDLVLPDGTFDPDRADEIRDLAAQAAVYATQARGPGTLRAYRSAWRQYDAWCVRLGLPALSGDPRLVGMYLTAAAERLAVATLQVHLAAIVTAHRLVGLSLDPGHPGIALLLDGIRRRRGTRPARQATPISPAMLARMVRRPARHAARSAQPRHPARRLRRRPAALRDRRARCWRSRVRRGPGRRADRPALQDRPARGRAGGRGLALRRPRPVRPHRAAPLARAPRPPATPTIPCSSACAPAAS